MEIRRILRQYAFTLTVILCAAVLLYGIISVRQKTRYNMDMTPYETVRLEDIGKILTEFAKKS